MNDKRLNKNDEQIYDFLTLSPPAQQNYSNSNQMHYQQQQYQTTANYDELISPVEPPPAPTTSLPPHFQLPSNGYDNNNNTQTRVNDHQLQTNLDVPTFNISVNQDLNNFYSTSTRPASKFNNAANLSPNLSPNSSINSNLNVNTATEIVGSHLTASSNQVNYNDLLSPTNFEYNRSHSNSFYTDFSSNLNSPFMDASSHFSYDGSDLSPNLAANNQSQLDLNFDFNLNDMNINNVPQINATDVYSPSNVNQQLQDQLDNLRATQQETQQFYNNNAESFNNPSNLSGLASQDLKYLDSKLNKLTEDNLQTNNILNHPSPITISIQEAPEAIAAKTPSLFSNSTHSSRHNSPINRSRANTNEMKNFGDTLSPNDNYNVNSNFISNNELSPTSPSSAISDNDLLKPEEFNMIRSGRQRSHSNKSRSRSKSTDSRRSDISTSREKMLELASPNQSNKRVQKHPSVYACHLCDKRFTRPYNLKSHLRTHTDERPFICTVCSKAFARQHDRKRHEDLHTGEKKFQCKGVLKNGTPYGCGRKFARADALRRHFQTEAGKECIRLLIEEAEQDKSKNGGPGLDPNDINRFSVKNEPTDTLSPTTFQIPQVAISPPPDGDSSMQM